MKVYLEVYGCTANKADADIVEGQLVENKHEIVDKINDADVLIILTCTVIGTTEQRMLSRLRVFKKTGKKIIVAGCMASVQKDLVKKILPDVVFLPPQDCHKINSLLDGNKIDLKMENKIVFRKKHDDVIAPLLISEGCQFSCSYCITSLARGKLKSFPFDEIRNNINSAVKQGCKEIQLTAQDTGSYGFDIGKNLGGLLRNVSEINGEYRIRVGMMNPYTAMLNLESIIEGYRDTKIYKFLHIPVQSGDNQILEGMNRKYTVEDFESILEKFREKYPDITISTDIIVGFPGETEEEFQHTVDLIKKTRPDITNITRFSARPFTLAKKMEKRIKTETVKKRSRQLTKICSRISYENNKNHVGKKYNVLITEKGKNKTFVGGSENYKPVVLDEKVDIGSFYPIEITNYAQTYLIGRLI